MEKPEMILFDYGNTLVYEPKFDSLAGTRALMPHLLTNPEALTAEELDCIVSGRREAVFACADRDAVEFHEHQFIRLLCDSLGLSFDLTPDEMEDLYWTSSTVAAHAMPGVADFLRLCGQKGIRTGVVSNLMFSGGALRRRINRFLPEAEKAFDFILASSEYLYRKPHRILFDIAVRKAGISADRIWFCGDNPMTDIVGAAGIGMRACWYQSGLKNWYLDETLTPPQDCPYTVFHDWKELETF